MILVLGSRWTAYVRLAGGGVFARQVFARARCVRRLRRGAFSSRVQIVESTMGISVAHSSISVFTSSFRVRRMGFGSPPENEAVLAFAGKGLADLASGCASYTRRWSSHRRWKAKKTSPLSRTRLVVPGLAGVDLRMRPALWVRVGAFICYPVGIVVKDALARFADYVLSAADFVVGLGTQHDLAAHAFLFAHLSQPGSAVLGNAIVMP